MTLGVTRQLDDPSQCTLLAAGGPLLKGVDDPKQAFGQRAQRRAYLTIRSSDGLACALDAQINGLVAWR